MFARRVKSESAAIARQRLRIITRADRFNLRDSRATPYDFVVARWADIVGENFSDAHVRNTHFPKALGAGYGSTIRFFNRDDR